ncbi:MAG: hypothetical protein AAFW75_23210 [Cyanobacteria bacterium J06636_16]
MSRIHQTVAKSPTTRSEILTQTGIYQQPSIALLDETIYAMTDYLPSLESQTRISSQCRASERLKSAIALKSSDRCDVGTGHD